MSSNLADLPLDLLADVPLSTDILWSRWVQIWQIYLPLSFLQLQKSLLVSFQRSWTQWQRFESSSTHHFWDTPQHFLKTHFCWESGFLSFLELQKSLLVSFQGCWTQWQRSRWVQAFTVSEILHWYLVVKNELTNLADLPLYICYRFSPRGAEHAFMVKMSSNLADLP